jgi:hypothetical protein
MRKKLITKAPSFILMMTGIGGITASVFLLTPPNSIYESFIKILFLFELCLCFLYFFMLICAITFDSAKTFFTGEE